MFEWIIFGLIAAVTITACITIGALRKAMAKAKINIAEIIDIDRVRNKVTLKDLESRVQITVTGDEISNEIYRGQKIRSQPVATTPKNEERESIFTPEEEAIFAEMEKEMERLEKEAEERGSIFTPEEEAMFAEMEKEMDENPWFKAMEKEMEEDEFWDKMII